MVDEDGNGMLSWEEIYNICQESLQVFKGNRDSEFIDSLSKFFTDYIFGACGIDNTVFAQYSAAQIIQILREQDKPVRGQDENDKIEFPEISRYKLRDLIVHGQNVVEDKSLFMMFCGVDCLENLDIEAEREQMTMDPNDVEYAKAISFLFEKVNKRKEIE